MALQIGRLIERVNRELLRHLDQGSGVGELWRRVAQVTGRKKKPTMDQPTTADELNSHYAAVSTDPDYTSPQLKNTAYDNRSFISKIRVFDILDRLKYTAPDADLLPACFLRLEAPVYCKVVAYLVNLSIRASHFPEQWEARHYSPHPQGSKPYVTS